MPDLRRCDGQERCADEAQRRDGQPAQAIAQRQQASTDEEHRRDHERNGARHHDHGLRAHGPAPSRAGARPPCATRYAPGRLAMKSAATERTEMRVASVAPIETPPRSTTYEPSR